MRSAKSTGRAIGVLLPLQSTAAYVENFVLLAPVLAGGAFLANAAGSALDVRVATLLGLAKGVFTVGIAIVAWPVFRRYSESMALWYLALCAVGLALMCVENVSILTMLSMSQEYAKGDSNAALPTAALVARWFRYWAHYTNLIVGGGATLVLYATLLRFALVPRALAAVGVVAVLLQLTAVARPVFGYPIVFVLLAPLGLSHLALAVWLLAKGFSDKNPGTQYA
jgi:hypothetical protein